MADNILRWNGTTPLVIFFIAQIGMTIWFSSDLNRRVINVEQDLVSYISEARNDEGELKRAIVEISKTNNDIMLILARQQEQITNLTEDLLDLREHQAETNRLLRNNLYSNNSN